MQRIPVYGAGPAGLMAAEVLARAGVAVDLHDHKPAPARKFLLAGRGGLNLTHSENIDDFLARYGEARPHLEAAIRAFSPADLQSWANDLGIETFVGSSGRIFPKAMKASPLLRAWLRRLSEMGVAFHPRSPWPGFEAPTGICAFGGASWPHLGSDASWVPKFREAGIAVTDFKPSNARALVEWTAHMSSKHAGAPLKTLVAQYNAHKAAGEIIISHNGLEGGAIYSLSRFIREEPGHPLIIDLKPGLSDQQVNERLARPRGKMSRSNHLRKALGLTPAAIALMHEAKSDSPKHVAVTIKGLAGLERAISSAGGVSWSALQSDFSLTKQPNWFVAGEMIDWDAPTGGYLLQASFATGAAAARGLLARLGEFAA